MCRVQNTITPAAMSDPYTQGTRRCVACNTDKADNAVFTEFTGDSKVCTDCRWRCTKCGGIIANIEALWTPGQMCVKCRG